MKITLLAFFFYAVGLTANAQTAKELIGKWQLVRYTHNGKDKDIKDFFKTDQGTRYFMRTANLKALSGMKYTKESGKCQKTIRN